MDINQIKKIKEELEQAILQSLRNFEKETGVDVIGLDLEFIRDIGNKYGPKVISVSLNITF